MSILDFDVFDGREFAHLRLYALVMLVNAIVLVGGVLVFLLNDVLSGRRR